jgi:hypothetical protein
MVGLFLFVVKDVEGERMRMSGRAMCALPVAGALLAMMAALAGCGAGTASQPDRQAGQVSQGSAGQSATPALDAFQAMARAAGCSEQRNRLFVIDGTQVLWDHAGNCADAAYGQVLFGATPDAVLCTSGDTLAGPRTGCTDPALRPLFDTVLANLDKADLGLGSAHKVERVDFLAAPGMTH